MVRFVDQHAASSPRRFNTQIRPRTSRRERRSVRRFARWQNTLVYSSVYIIESELRGDAALISSFRSPLSPRVALWSGSLVSLRSPRALKPSSRIAFAHQDPRNPTAM